jgi:cell division transport system permease protein
VSLVIREAFISFRRTPSLSILSIITIGFALFVVGLFGLVALNFQEALEDVGERVEVVVYLTRGTPETVALAAYDDILTFPEVESVEFVSADEALTRAREELIEFQGLYGDLSTNPLPASLGIKLKTGFRNQESVQAVAERVRGFRFAEDIQYGDDWISTLDRIRNVAGIVGLVVGSAFALASIMIIGTTIRMTIIQRAREIEIMRLVGATDGFIRMPFLLEGLVKGALGGITAVGLNYGVYQLVNRTLLEASFFQVEHTAMIVGFGTVLGFFSTVFGVRKHLRSV